MRQVKEQLAAFGHYSKKQASRLTAWMILSPIRFFIAAILLIVPLIFILDLFWLKAAGGFGGVLVEAHGLVFDLIVFGVIAALYEHYRQQHENAKKAEVEKQQRIERYQEEIDDFRGWDEKEAIYRIIGAIKRLNKEGISAINLSCHKLKGADLRGVNLSGGKLISADLREADLREVNLTGANLAGADLTLANMPKTDLQGAIFLGANLTNTYLALANLSKAHIYGVNFTNALLFGANLTGANLIFIKSRHDWLEYAKYDADFEYLPETRFSGASLSRVVLTDVEGLTFEILKSVHDLNDVIGLPEDILTQLKQEKPEIFESRPR